MEDISFSDEFEDVVLDDLNVGEAVVGALCLEEWDGNEDLAQYLPMEVSNYFYK